MNEKESVPVEVESSFLRERKERRGGEGETERTEVQQQQEEEEVKIRAREAAARERIEDAREQARLIAGARGRGVEFSLNPPRGPVNSETVIKIKTASNESRDILDIVSGARAAGVRIVFGEKIGVDLSSFGKETEKRTVVVPTDLEPRDLPFLIREIIRAAKYDEKKVFLLHKKKKKKKDEEGEEESITVINQTAAGYLIKAELDARKKLEEGWVEIQRDFGHVPFYQILEKYKKLETKHSRAWRPAEHIIDELMREAEADWAQTTGIDLFEPYGGKDDFRQELRQRTMSAQVRLVHQMDEKSSRLYLTGETRGLFWTLTTGISRTAAKRRLLRKLHGLDEAGRVFSGSLSRKNIERAIWQGTWGDTFGKTIGAGALLLLELGLLIPRKAANAVLETADDWLYNLQTKFGSWAYGKKYKPRLKKMAERREEGEKEFEKLVKKARGRQE